QWMPVDKARNHRLADGRGVVQVMQEEKARPRIVDARFISRRRKLHEGVMLADGDRFRRRRHVANPAARLLSRKCQGGLDFRIQGKILGLRKVNGASRRVQMISALLHTMERGWNAM